MSTTENETLVRRIFHEGSNAPNPQHVLNDLYAPGFVCHGPPGVEHSHAGGAEPLERCIFNDAFADVRFTVGDLTTEGDRVTAKFTARGKHIAEFHGVAGTGKEVTVDGVCIFRIDRGQLVEGWGTLNWT